MVVHKRCLFLRPDEWTQELLFSAPRFFPPVLAAKRGLLKLLGATHSSEALIREVVKTGGTGKRMEVMGGGVLTSGTTQIALPGTESQHTKNAMDCTSLTLILWVEMIMHSSSIILKSLFINSRFYLVGCLSGRLCCLHWALLFTI